MRIFTFGCSFTEGQCLENQREESYSGQIYKKTNIKTINSGTAGVSNDYIFRKVFEYLKKHIKKDDFIIIQWTHYIRKEIPIVYNNRNFYLYTPSCSYPLEPGNIDVKNNIMVSQYVNQNLDEEKKIIEKIYNPFFLEYIDKSLNEEYQKETTENYIHSLYNYLENNEYKHLHFFGWDSCKEPFSFNYEKIIQTDTFGGYTKTINNNHPDKYAHEIWADYLIQKIDYL